MKILYYIDPLLSANTTDTSYATYRFHVSNLKKTLDKLGENAPEPLVLTDKKIRVRAERQGVCDDIPTATLCADALMLGDVSAVAAMRAWSRGDYTEADVETVRAAVLNACGEFAPDVVIASETPAIALRKAFPELPILSESWGIFSRAPFPLLVNYDREGLYRTSTLARMGAEIRDLAASAETTRAFDRFRAKMAEAIAQHDPVRALFDRIRPEFDKLVLLPLQGRDDYAFHHAAGELSQLEMVRNILKVLSANIGLVVTMHPERGEALDDEEIELCKREFRNFIHFPELDRIPFASTFALPKVDGVIAASSNVAFQAAFLRIPVFTTGLSHTTAVSSGGPADVARVLDETPIVDRDGAIAKILTNFNVFLEVDQADAHNFVSHLETLMAAHKGGDRQQAEAEFNADHLGRMLDSYNLSGAVYGHLHDRGIPFSADHLYMSIARSQAVSFDLFDTLAERPFMDPHILFYALEQNVRRIVCNPNFRFLHWRLKAEENARKEVGWQETDFDSIYRHFQNITGLSDELCQSVMAAEFGTETKMLTRRDPYYRSLVWAKRLGKPVSIITDIYYDEARIRSLLDQTDIRFFDALYVSAEIGIRKHDGSVFPTYLADLYQNYGVTAKMGSIVHIGDNGHADGVMAQQAGIETVIIPRAIDRFMGSSLGHIFEANKHKRHAISDFLAGLIANRFDGDAAAVPNGSLFDGSWFRCGYAAAGPMLVAYVQWVIRRVRAAKLTKVFFVARDGWILKEIYDRIREAGIYPDLPPSGYIYLSRRSTAVAAMEGPEDIADLLHLPFGTRKLGDLLEHRFGLPREHLPLTTMKKFGFKPGTLVNDNDEFPRLCAFFEAIETELLDNAKDEREALLRYLDLEEALQHADKGALVDIGYSGSIQRFVQKITHIKIPGYYMLTHEAARRGFDNSVVEAFYNNWDEPRMADCHPLNDFIFLFETVLSSKEASLKRHRFDDEGNWSMDTVPLDREPHRLIFMERIHHGIITFAEDFIRQSGSVFDDLLLGPYLGSKVFFRMAHHPTHGDAKLFSGLKVENAFGGGDAWLLWAPPGIVSDPARLAEVGLGRSQWKEAAHALYGVPAPAAPPGAPPVGGVITQTPVVVQAPVSPTPAPVYVHVHQTVPVASSGPAHPINEAPVRMKGVVIPRAVRRYVKFRTNPYGFFNDSKIPPVRLFRHFFRAYA